MLFKNEKICWRTVLLVLAFALCLNLGVSAAHRTILQQGIAEEVLRFHVLADSDSEEDQAVKYEVRDAVIAWIAEKMEQNKSYIKLQTQDMNKNKPDDKEMTAEFLSEHLTEIEQVADEVLAADEMPYRASAELIRCYFPDRTYDGYTFPAGWYDALRIRLGEAKGQNWWCVLYPRLCFSDCLHGVVEDEEMEKLEKTLTVEEYETLLEEPSEWKISFRWF